MKKKQPVYTIDDARKAMIELKNRLDDISDCFNSKRCIILTPKQVELMNLDAKELAQRSDIEIVEETPLNKYPKS